MLAFPEVERPSYFSLKRLMGVSSVCVAMISGVLATSTLDAEEIDSSFDVANEVTKTATKMSEVAPAAGTNIITAKETSIKLQANDDVWVRISDHKGDTVIERILTKGEDYIAPSADNLKLMTNNAAALSVLIGGEKLESLGNTGEIIQDLSLHSEKLLELTMLR
ncbi:DUF4115 domain-containing protein [Pseudemcibacter aquimaris]|uniref:DUF4115 domain-containing protein n=1 Tax=Pseudemcibacter aquimaris TaxID=2857064 RepID=UPI0020134CE6|nr:DUF4115 domain-containing protein [Pseudemcibacter aquimaris]MCC3861794.1 DUF4115 domain-containing protein [Pseudemcibacter aquimaris]WDU58549.1 DUF4115 domain-containing protein [Pseudemcibacter aquimaris]